MKLILLFISLAYAAIFAAPVDNKQAAIQIDARPIHQFSPGDPSRSRFGALEFRGGLVLSSSYQGFGGISALLVQSDGSHFIALSDRGSWLRGQITYDGTRPTGIAHAEMAPFLGPGAKEADRRDTESIAENGSTLYVGIERENVILRLKYPQKGFPRGAAMLPVPPGIGTLPNNQGLEALAFVPRKLPLTGTLIAFSERDLDAAENLKAFLIGGPHPGTFTVKRSDDYDISDSAILPGGDLLILERKYTLLGGPSARIRSIRLDQIKPDALVDGPVIFEADVRNEIDNMEALSVHRSRSGEIVLTLMSDDNFSSIQRTLLLQFAYIEEPKQ